MTTMPAWVGPGTADVSASGPVKTPDAEDRSTGFDSFVDAVEGAEDRSVTAIAASDPAEPGGPAATPTAVTSLDLAAGLRTREMPTDPAMGTTSKTTDGLSLPQSAEGASLDASLPGRVVSEPAIEAEKTAGTVPDAPLSEDGGDPPAGPMTEDGVPLDRLSAAPDARRGIETGGVGAADPIPVSRETSDRSPDLPGAVLRPSIIRTDPPADSNRQGAADKAVLQDSPDSRPLAAPKDGADLPTARETLPASSSRPEPPALRQPEIPDTAPAGHALHRAADATQVEIPRPSEAEPVRTDPNRPATRTRPEHAPMVPAGPSSFATPDPLSNAQPAAPLERAAIVDPTPPRREPQSRLLPPDLSPKSTQIAASMPASPNPAPLAPSLLDPARLDGTEFKADWIFDPDPIVSAAPAGTGPAGPTMPVSGPGANPVAIVRQIAAHAENATPAGVEIELDPPELGRLRLLLTPADSGLSAQISMERPETLELLRRHADLLQRALADAGFPDAALSFDLGAGADRRERSMTAGAPDAGEDRLMSIPGSGLPADTASPASPARAVTANGLDIRL